MEELKESLGLVLNEKVVREQALEDRLLLDGLRVALNQLLGFLHYHWVDLLDRLVAYGLRF